MKLTSADFKENNDIPARYTQEGENVSPTLDWFDVPRDCKSFALICEDPDAPKKSKHSSNFTHWVVYNISPNVGSLPEGLPQKAELDLPVFACQGKNSFGNLGYDGPMPPMGSGPHRYVFTVYACKKLFEIKPGAEKSILLDAMKGNILATAKLTGYYERTKQRSEKSSSLSP